MSFIEQRLPECISFGATFGPEYQTNVVVVNSGHESRNSNWAKSRLVANIGYRNKTKADTDALIAWFRSVKGRAHGFRIKDWSDYKADATNGEFISLGNDEYQLCKRYAAGGLNEVREIRKPVAATVQILDDNGNPIGVSYDLDSTTGILTIGSTPASWAGEFDVPVRFDVDKLELEVSDRSAAGLVYSWPSIPLIELRG